MLADFLDANRADIIALARERLSSRRNPKATTAEVKEGLPIFLDQLGEALKLAETRGHIDEGAISRAATSQGGRLFDLGLTIGQLVHDYGDVCQAITELAVERGELISAEDFQMLNRVLDEAIAWAAAEYLRQRDVVLGHKSDERLAVLARQMRTIVTTAMISAESIRTGRVSCSGATATLHRRSLAGLLDLIDHSLAGVRLESDSQLPEHIAVRQLVEDVEIPAIIEAQARGLEFSVSTMVDRTVTIEGDRQILAAALAALLSNAFKHSVDKSPVVLRTSLHADRVLFEVEHECEDLPATDVASLAGRGLAIGLRAARASGGELRTANGTGKACRFILDLPRKAPRSSS